MSIIKGLDNLMRVFKKSIIGIMTATLLASNIVSAASFPSQYENPMPLALGIDVSVWNAKNGRSIDWQAVKNFGVSFVIIKISKRDPDTTLAELVDERFEDFYNGAGAAGLKRGVYVFSYAKNESDAVAEANACLNTLAGRPLEMPVAYDIESNSNIKKLIKKGKAATSDAINAFCDTVEAAGYDSMLYTGANFFRSYIDADLVSDRKLWIARYASLGSNATYSDFSNYSPTTTPYYMWQFSSTANIPSISYTTVSKGKATSHCDVNFIYDPKHTDSSFNNILYNTVTQSDYVYDEYDIPGYNTNNPGNNTNTNNTNVISEPTSIVFTESYVTIDGNNTSSRKLGMMIFPENADQSKIQYMSSDDSIATVSKDGTITPIKTGTVIITANSGFLSASATVNIIKDENKLSSLEFDEPEIFMYSGEKTKVKATATPNDANTKIEYFIDDSSLASISGDGTIKAKAAGETIIIAKAGPISAECDLIIEEAIEKPQKKDKKKDDKKPEAPTDITDKPIKDTPQQPEDKKASNKADKKTSKNKKKDNEAKGLDIKESSIKLGIGDVYKFSFTKPKNMSFDDIVWHSSDTGIISGYNNGKMTAKSVGTATLTIKSKSDSKLKDTVKVTVFNLPTKLSANIKAKTLKKGATFKLKPSFNKNAFATVSYKSSNKKVVKVSKNGNLRAVGKGKATITLTTSNKLKATVTITVNQGGGR